MHKTIYPKKTTQSLRPADSKTSAWLATAIMLILTACTHQRPPQIEPASEYPAIFPDYIGVTIPAEIAPMNFNMADETDLDEMYVKVTGSKQGEMESMGKWADFDIKKWHELTAANVGADLIFDVYVKTKAGDWLRYKPFEMHVSADGMTDYGVTYRKIAPGFETFSKIGIYQRALSNFDEDPILEETAVNGQCLNCHYANKGNPEQFSIHIRGANGGTLLHRNGENRYLNTKTERTVGSCTYGYWHPEGRYCAYSLNRIYQNFYVGNSGQYVEPWDYVSDLVVLDSETDQLICSPLLSDEDCQTTPCFSADGKTIYFCHAPKANMPGEYDKLKYSIVSIGFDTESRKFADKIDTLISSTEYDKSLSLPRQSYDGKYMMYTVTEYGTTPIVHPDADLWLMDMQTGDRRPLDEANSDQADAYHNWSSDSRWYLFGSKREDGLYALLYLASIDDEGRSTKPFLMPQRNPKKYYTESLYSYNAPDFTVSKVDLDARAVNRMVMSGETKQVTID